MTNPEEGAQEKPEQPGNPKPRLQAITHKVGGGTGKLKQAVEFLGQHPFVTGVLALLGVGGSVFSIISYGIDRDESRQTGEQLAQVEVALASVTSELQNSATTSVAPPTPTWNSNRNTMRSKPPTRKSGSRP